MSQEPEERQRDRSNRWPELLFAAGLVLIILVLMVLVSIWIPKPVPQVQPAVVKAVRPVLDLPREQLLLEAGRVLKAAPMASDDERQRQIAFVEAIRKLTAEQEEPDAFLLQTVTKLFVSLPRSIRSALGDLAVSNSAATLREELFGLLLSWIPRKLLTAEQLLLVNQAADDVERMSLIRHAVNNDVMPGSGELSAAQLLPLVESCLTQVQKDLQHERAAGGGYGLDSEMSMMQELTDTFAAFPDLAAADQQRVTETMQALADRWEQIQARPEPSRGRAKSSYRRRRR